VSSKVIAGKNHIFGAVLKSHSEFNLTRSISTRSHVSQRNCESQLAPKKKSENTTKSVRFVPNDHARNKQKRLERLKNIQKRSLLSSWFGLEQLFGVCNLMLKE
jgi:hypothetical protein